MDLSKIPTEDLQAISKGDWKSVSTPGLQAYQGAMQQESQAQTQSLNPQQIPDAADKAAQNNSPSAKPVSLVNNRYFPSGSSMGGMPAQASQDNPDANKLFAKLGTGLATGGMGAAATEGISGLAGLAARTAANSGGAGLQQYFSNLMDNKPSMQGVGGASALGGGLSLGLEGAGALTGKIGDYLMQKSVGMRKYYPGTGTQLADMGVVGTKNMMANQVTDKLAKQEQNLQEIVKDLTGTVNSKEIADAISQKAQRFTLPDKGTASPFSQAELQKVRDLADQTSQMGDLSGRDLLALKRQGDYQAFTASGNPASSTEAELARTGANAARTALKKMSPEAADSLLNEQALIRANGPLNKPETIHQGMGSSMFFGKMPGQALLGSVGGQVGVKGGQALDAIANPAVLQGLFGAVKGSQ